jgi:hypothetical protein
VASVSTVGHVDGPTMVSVGSIASYTGTITFSDGVDRPTAVKIWISSNQTVATIDSSGRLTARTAGTTTVSVSSPGIGNGGSTPGTLGVRVN